MFSNLYKNSKAPQRLSDETLAELEELLGLHNAGFEECLKGCADFLRDLKRIADIEDAPLRMPMQRSSRERRSEDRRVANQPLPEGMADRRKGDRRASPGRRCADRRKIDQ